MQIIDTFSGIGGFSLAGKQLGWRTIQFCEIDKFCQRVLSYHFPGVPIHHDIKTLTAEQIKQSSLYDPNEPTIWTGGVPCQPWSLAGQRKGTKDDRDLWPETLKLIGEFKPDWAVLENVYGLVNWNGGLVFEQIQADLEDEGYEVQPIILPACGVNAPHRRDRVWFVARKSTPDTMRNGFKRADQSQEINNRRIQEGVEKGHEFNSLHGNGDVTDTRNKGLQGNKLDGAFNTERQIRREQSPGSTPKLHQGNYWQNWPTVAPVCERINGLSSRLSGITFPKWRNESIKAMGNAIVPQVAYEIFKVIEQMQYKPK